MVLLITGSFIQEISCDDDGNTSTVNVTQNAIENGTTTTTVATTTIVILNSSTSTEEFPLLEDLVLTEEHFVKSENIDHDNDSGDVEKNTAKRTISSKFTGPIIVDDDVKLFTPVDELTRKQINVQIIEPENHNNGQFLKETVYVKQENSTVVSSKLTTTTTTERPSHRQNIFTQKTASSRYLAPIQAGLRLSNEGKSKQRNNDDDCDDETTEIVNVATEGKLKKVENIDIQKNTKIQRISYNQDEARKNLPFGTRFSSTTKSPCELASSPCSTTYKSYRPVSSTVRYKPINTTPLLPPRIYTTPSLLTTTSTVASIPSAVHSTTTIVPKPIYVHTVTEVPTVRFVERPVEKIVKQIVSVPSPPVEKIVPYEVEKLVVKEVKVPTNTVIEKHINHPPTVVEKLLPYPVHNVIHAKPIEVEKIVHKEVPVAYPVDRIIEKHVPYQVSLVWIELLLLEATEH